MNQFNPVVFINSGLRFEGEIAWNKWKNWMDINRRDDFVYKVLDSIKRQNYKASPKQQAILNKWFSGMRENKIFINMDIKKIIREILVDKNIIKDDCGCGCNDCGGAPLINESKKFEAPISEAFRYHIENKLPITENIFRAGSLSHVSLLLEARQLYDEKIIILNGKDKWLFENTDLGKYDLYEGKMVPLDLPLIYEDEFKPTLDEKSLFDRLFDWVGNDLKNKGIRNGDDLKLEFKKDPLTMMNIISSMKGGQEIPKNFKNHLDYYSKNIEESSKPKKKTPPIGKPKRGGSKKFYVYVRKPGGGIKKVSFGMAGGGLRAKLNNPKARRAFAKRHNCAQAKDRTTARYWSCRLPRYSKLLGFKTTFSGYW